MRNKQVIKKIGLTVFRNKKLLAARSNNQTDIFFLPGGKIENGESDIECLKREIREELDSDIDESSIHLLHEFIGPAHGKPDAELHMKVYTAMLLGEPKPNGEIEELKYIDSSDEKHLSEIARTQIFPWLKEHEYIK